MHDLLLHLELCSGQAMSMLEGVDVLEKELGTTI
jgi:hypothetical protein